MGWQEICYLHLCNTTALPLTCRESRGNTLLTHFLSIQVAQPTLTRNLTCNNGKRKSWTEYSMLRWVGCGGQSTANGPAACGFGV
jgi:hypothetical protein